MTVPVVIVARVYVASIITITVALPAFEAARRAGLIQELIARAPIYSFGLTATKPLAVTAAAHRLAI